MAGKRLNLASLAGQTVENTPGSSKPTLVHVAPDQVAPTPLNPRQDFNPAQLVELGNSMATGQLQPCVGISRARYIKLFPEHEEQLPDCRIVMAAGERRWKAALEVGLPLLDVHVREDIAESRVRFLAAVLTENVERSNFNFIEEARGLKLMLDMTDGNQTQAAEGLQKSKQWFSQRIGLLRLSEEMQALVVSGKLKAFREMRAYSAMPPAEQFAAWQADRAEAERMKAIRAARTKAAVAGTVPTEKPSEGGDAYTAVYTEPGGVQTSAPQEAMSGPTAVEPQPAAAQPAGVSANTQRPAVQAPTPDSGSGLTQDAASPQSPLPEPRHEKESGETSDGPAASEPTPVKMPWHDGAAVARLAFLKMPKEQLPLMLAKLQQMLDQAERTDSTKV
ncbi:ParB/RepB/Spo0J family partition protein [Streptomyces sp. NPDC048445]|uniref:ParB/RepB/Spo0J family partition protein n=1 Tax=Streptomyces sp. NPDC048445 TaxID=3365553 RepID=UPI00372274A0